MPTLTTDLLEIAYEDAGPRDGPPVLLLHGWPDSPRCWQDVAPRLNAAGLRTIVPALRGFAPTRFRDPDVPRTAQIVALAQDALDLLDHLGLDRVVVVGHDWGARAGYALAGLAPQRVDRIGVPTLMIHGGSDTCVAPAATEDRGRYFTAGYRRVVVPGAGHFVPREAP